ncbi:MAG: endonuclease/exonuclease/phosphatase family protein [Bacteroidetes bacterium]|nr:endonuclease/exonuclease/phosphatase family protein [Bacteroidota bacterium]
MTGQYPFLKVVTRLFLFGFILTICTTGFSQSIRLTTWNLRLDIASDSLNQWKYRKDEVARIIRSSGASVIGTQEGFYHQLTDLTSRLPSFGFVGKGRDDGKKGGEFCAILFDSMRVTVLQDSTFWLSQTPDKPVKGWDAAYLRVCTGALFRDQQSGKSFWVFNLHADNEGERAREEGSRLVLSAITSLTRSNPDLPVIVMGDFNATDKALSVQLLQKRFIDARLATRKKPAGPEGTFNGFRFPFSGGPRIDYLFVPESATVLDYLVDDHSVNQRYPSDHFPVTVTLILP